MPPRAPRIGRVLGCLGALAVLLAVVAVIAVVVLRQQNVVGPTPVEPRCVARSGDTSVAITPDQSYWTSIVTGVSIRRGMPPRAASIAMATVYQESGIRNLDHGDRDSVGLFQQRPSQGWGSVEEIMDPWYSSNAFYAALAKVPDWQTDDINDVAQKVQRSGFPQAYRKHEGNARVLASVFTGHSPAALRCTFDELAQADPRGLATHLEKTLGVKSRRGENTLVVRAASTTAAWAVGSQAVATAGRYGVQSVRVAGREWTHQEQALPEWAILPEDAGRTVTITFAI